MNYWKVFCQESRFPGLWPRWFKDQCAAVGWNPRSGYTMEGKSRAQDWTMARNCLNRVRSGDMVLVQLKDNRVARVGEVVPKEVDDDQWNPTTHRTREYPLGHLGRRIALRWDLNIGSTDPDTVAWLPISSR